LLDLRGRFDDGVWLPSGVLRALRSSAGNRAAARQLAEELGDKAPIQQEMEILAYLDMIERRRR
jgi:hypothetical protein